MRAVPNEQIVHRDPAPAVLDDGFFPIPVHAKRIDRDAEHGRVVKGYDLGAPAFQSGRVEEDGVNVLVLIADEVSPGAIGGQVLARSQRSLVALSLVQSSMGYPPLRSSGFKLGG